MNTANFALSKRVSAISALSLTGRPNADKGIVRASEGKIEA